MRVADYIAERLAKLGVKYIYGIMGGGAAGLNDAFIINEKLKYICFHHEQGRCHTYAQFEIRKRWKFSSMRIERYVSIFRRRRFTRRNGILNEYK